MGNAHPTNWTRECRQFHCQKIDFDGVHYMQKSFASRVVVVLAYASVITGCGSQGEPNPIQLADATVVKPTDPAPDLSKLPQPKLTVVEPQAGDVFSVGDGRHTGGIRCVVRVEIPSGGKAPEIVSANLFNGALIAGSTLLKIKEKSSDDIWILEGDLDSPPKKGNYKLRAEGMQTLIIGKDINLAPPDAIKINKIHSPDVSIRIAG